MTKVRNFYIDNRLGHLDEALAVANSPTGGVYPVGTIIQLVPQEAMVKREKGFNPATRDWEFFFLSVSPDGTVIDRRGTTDVVNRFGGNCASCHQGAQARFDGVCEENHGCAPLPIGPDLIHAVQESDPRPVS
jgi:mono/diheme cytochrome c family protein